MPEDPKENPAQDPETPAQEKLTEALLSEYARAGSGDDEDFVESVVNAITPGSESPSPQIIEEEVPEELLVPAKRPRAKAAIIGLSVALAFHFALVVFLGLIVIATPRQEPPEIVAYAAAASESIPEFEVKRAPRSVTPSPAPSPDSLRLVRSQIADASSASDSWVSQPGQLRLDVSSPPAPTAAPAAASTRPVPSASTVTASSAAGPVYGGRNIYSRNKAATGTGLSIAPGESDHWRYQPPVDRERYGELIDNRWASPFDAPLSTFSIDVDTAAYTNLRRMITDGTMVPKDAIRIEEMINYFDYDYPRATGKHPFAFALESASCPWNEEHRLVRVGLQGKEIKRHRRPRANLVFLLDVSGSMKSDRKLPLVRDSMKILVEELADDDLVSIVVYAGAEGLALPPTPGSKRNRIFTALENLSAGGSTNGGAGIELAYRTATENFIEDGINRVILCTDGDFNVGVTSNGSLVDLVEERAQGGTFLSVLGFGGGNINDSMLEAITNKGNGTYYYIDSLSEGRKVFLEDLMGTLVTIAKDVKIQVEFNPSQVESYRLIGYANRMLEAEDFENDKIDAGEIGAGHQVTALYEIVPAGATAPGSFSIPPLKYQREVRSRVIPSAELLTVKLRYKEPDGDTSKLLEVPFRDEGESWRHASEDFQFASSVALFGLILRESEYIGDATLSRVIEIGATPRSSDPKGRRREFRDLVSKHLEVRAR